MTNGVRKEMQIVEGLGLSPGVAIGQAICITSRAGDVFRVPIEESEVEEEIARLRAAVEHASAELETTQNRVGQELGDELAEIFQAHSLMLDDFAFLGRIEEYIRRQRVNAEWAVHSTTEELEKRFESLESPHHQARSEDLVDVARYLMGFLRGTARYDLSQIGGDRIVVADDLTPSEAVRVGREKVLGFAVETGGPTSHTTIIARSLHLPLVAGLADVSAHVTDNDPVILDGDAGRLILHPTPEVLEEHRRKQVEQAEAERLLTPIRDLPSVTRDGAEVKLLANIDLLEEIDEALRYGAEGVGLYRSEFLYIEKSPELPSEEEHTEIYRELIARMRPHPVTIRTFDLGGRKLAREVLETREENPVLGLRGIRLTLTRPEIFEIQIRALLRAGRDGGLRILLPMVSTLEEVLQFKQRLQAAERGLQREGLGECCPVDLGVMIEVPSAAMVADRLAREVDFFAIGTNDLIQYAMAVDRNNEHVSYLYRPLHPAILRMIRFTVEAAARAEIDVSICGEMAGDPRYLPLLLGLGLRSISASPRSLPEIKSRVRELSVEEWVAPSRRCLEFSTAAEVERLLELDSGVEAASET